MGSARFRFFVVGGGWGGGGCSEVEVLGIPKVQSVEMLEYARVYWSRLPRNEVPIQISRC